MNTNKKRLTILTQPEIQDYFSLPRFTLEEEYYFTLSDTEHQIIPQGWSVTLSKPLGATFIMAPQ
ncbi:hypothetical protein [Xenorhabdus eapokensis]|uniref:hypothetical protein n=1 Tax=Xenorhabdus eapokensis TaxID=1873482 RepID=UPI00093DE877|nr:hypothetical protein [Xenorhabdus eapokensis]